MVKKDCYHCIHFRPRRGFVCSFTREKINEYNSYYCDRFREDSVVINMSEEQEKNALLEDIKKNKK